MRRYMVLFNPKQDGTILYDHCRVIYDKTGIWPKEYPRPEIPVFGNLIWDWYWDLRLAAPFGYSGPGPLFYTEIEAWSHLHEIKLKSADLRLIKCLDQQYLDCWYEEQKKRNKK